MREREHSAHSIETRTVSMKRARVRKIRTGLTQYSYPQAVKNVLIFYRVFKQYIRRRHIRHVRFVRPDTLNSPDNRFPQLFDRPRRNAFSTLRCQTAVRRVDGYKLVPDNTRFKRVDYFHGSFVE